MKDIATKISETEIYIRRLRTTAFEVTPENEAAHTELIAKAKRRLLRLRRQRIGMLGAHHV